MGIQQDIETLRSSFNDMRQHEESLEKSAADLGDVISAVGGFFAANKGLKTMNNFGKAKSNEFLHAGLALGKEGKKINSVTKNVGQNLLGNSSMEPYEVGSEIGKRIRNHEMDETTEQRFLNKIKGIATAKLNKGESGNALRALSEYGNQEASPLLQKVLRAGAKEEDAKEILGTMAGNALTAPLAVLDKRVIIRPLLRSADEGIINTLKEKTVTMTPEQLKVGLSKTRDVVDQTYSGVVENADKVIPGVKDQINLYEVGLKQTKEWLKNYING